MKTITIKILKWINEFKNEIKEINMLNKYNNLKTNTNILKEEQAHLNQEFNVYMDKLKIKHTKNLKHTFKLSIIINFLIVISATFTVLGFNLHDMTFQITTNISKGIIGLSLIIGLILIQYLCFYAASIQTTITNRFGKHVKGLKRIKYILIPISIIGTYNFLIDYITFTNIYFFNCLIVFMICISIDYTILIFSGIRFDKKHLIFSDTTDVIKDDKSILHIILFNLVCDKLLKVRLNYLNKVNNYNKKLAEEKEKLAHEKVNIENKKLAINNLELTKVSSVNLVKSDIAKRDTTELTKVSTGEKKVSNESKKLAHEKVNIKKVSIKNNEVNNESKKLTSHELTYNDKLRFIKHKLKDMKENENVSIKNFNGLNISRGEWVKMRKELINKGLVYTMGTATKKINMSNKKVL